MSIDSYRFLDFATRQVMKAWAARQQPGVIPFATLEKPLSECTVAVVSTAGIARNDDRPFDQEGERRNPWWGDPSFRVIPLGTSVSDVRLYHLHIDPRFGQADLDVVLPMRRLTSLRRQASSANRRRGTTRSWGTSSNRTCSSERPRRRLRNACAPTAWTRPLWCRHDPSAAGPLD